MKILYNESLKKYTTIKIGGIAKEMFIPENENELINVIMNHKDIRVLGGGSNLLINDREFDYILNLRDFNKTIEYLGDGKYFVGASVRLQKLIIEINNKGNGGIEYLYSVPGLVGGAVTMNAGGSKEQGWSISDHIVEVRVFHNNKIEILPKEKCKFNYRNSIFKNNRNYIITGVVFKFDNNTPKYYEKRRKERLTWCKQYQEANKPNFGSVFYHSNWKIMKIFSVIGLGSKNKAHFSKKTVNWIINEGDATFKDVTRLLKIVKKVHKLLKFDCIEEVIIWE